MSARILGLRSAITTIKAEAYLSLEIVRALSPLEQYQDER
jgi:hypothetical protein